MQQRWVEDRAVGRALHIGSGPKPIAGAVNLDPNPDRWRWIDVSGDALRFPFPNGTFDSIVSSHVLPALDDLPRALREMARVLRPGGIMAHVVPDRRYAPKRTDKRFPWDRQRYEFYGPDDLRPFLEVLTDVFQIVTLENFRAFNWSFKLEAVRL